MQVQEVKMSHTETNLEAAKIMYPCTSKNRKKATNFVSLNQVLVISSVKFAIVRDSFLSSRLHYRQRDCNVRYKLGNGQMWKTGHKEVKKEASLPARLQKWMWPSSTHCLLPSLWNKVLVVLLLGPSHIPTSKAFFHSHQKSLQEQQLFRC